MAQHISFNPLSTEASFLKNQSNPHVIPNHVGESSIVRTLNNNGPAIPDGYARQGYPTANNTPAITTRLHLQRVGRPTKNAMDKRNAWARAGFNADRQKIKSEGHSSYYEKSNDNLNDAAMTGMRRSRVRNQGNAEYVGQLLENNLHAEGLNIAPELRYARGKNLKPAPARGALKGSRNKARAQAEANARAQAEAAQAAANATALAARYQVAEQSIVNDRSNHPVNQEKETELQFIKSQEENLKEADANNRRNNRGNFNKLGGSYKKRRTVKKNKRHTRRRRI
jgi:hypothetical protein